MKLFKYTFAALCFSLVSCGSSFLEVAPIGQLGKEQLFSNVNGMRDALMGSYSLTSRFFQSQYGIYGDLRGDDVQRSTTSTQNYMLTDYNYNVDEEDGTGGTMAIWSSGYEALNNINNIINSAAGIQPTLNGNLDDFNRYLGQSHIIRGLLFLALANVYAQHYTYTADASHPGIPIPTVTPLPSQNLPRATMKDTYAQIIKDMETGIQYLDNLSPATRIYASSDAARALLSRIYLYMGRYDEAIQYASEVVSKGSYPLVKNADYKDMFIAESQLSDYNSIKSEVIWQLNLNTRSANYMSSFYSDRTSFLAYPSKAFLNFFETTDVRRNLYELQASSGNSISLKNAKNIAIPDINWPVNFKVIRTSELYLNRAEAYYHTKQHSLAEEDIKMIRARALNKNVADIIVQYSSPEELLDQIKMERRKELAFEGQRIYDIMRYKESLNRGTDCGAANCTVNYPNDLFILPIPKTELDANPSIKPNPTVNK
ncbi:RagB/SusD family nutrient uptake outer membrane protein [Sphingobacterium faecium]|uniref:RagB/SusD family nutrient uptake outer membrane protein n=1 Tax=Sphingobacterium faecium TaxID=34087 RepID=UPI00097ED4EE|nr:RagB/SusD family nutrient uptake outer membrane protein [Sphingobacterium faecium]WGQ16110.1 RagB/SusD family nutrient uptake outer membrane protein [Sphingobacterium faecium]SJN49724.1 putative outer membrane protein, probably involved in nutrient binding [Sphingobacterium faecium PCAi_F2.5]HCU43919.1 RagB/SusD family nutrient uptake outer membrane protein [Sphingobacterium sp.]